VNYAAIVRLIMPVLGHYSADAGSRGCHDILATLTITAPIGSTTVGQMAA
jgi:hypothetical protein